MPIFAPIIIGIAVFTSTTEISNEFLKIIFLNIYNDFICLDYIEPWRFRALPPLDTRDTITDVQVEELWTRTVKRTPIINPTTGLLRTSFPANISPADCPANSRNASVKKVKEHTNI